jgi:hypothetical protein
MNPRVWTLGARTGVTRATGAAAESRGPRIITRRTLSLPRSHHERADEAPVASLAIAWIQPTAGRSGGSSRRAARRAGRVHRDWKAMSRPAEPGRSFPRRSSVAALPKGAADGAPLGSAGSPHGAELTHGFASTWTDRAPPNGSGVRMSVSRGPQQQDPPRHLPPPHLQWCVSVSAFRAGAGESVSAVASPCQPRPKTSRTAGSSQRVDMPVHESRVLALTPAGPRMQAVQDAHRQNQTTIVEEPFVGVKGTRS